MVLQAYSKRLVNSDIPCCNCCEENTQYLNALGLRSYYMEERQYEICSPNLKKVVMIHRILKNNALIRCIKKTGNWPEGFQTFCQ